MILRKFANFILFGILHVCIQSTLNFVFKLWTIVEKIKTGIDKLLQVSKMKKSSLLGKYIGKFFLLSKPKVVYLRPFFIISTISKIFKTKCYLFWTQTCRNCTKLYHMPLIK